MKRIISLTLCILIMLSFCSCSKKQTNDTPAETLEPVQQGGVETEIYYYNDSISALSFVNMMKNSESDLYDNAYSFTSYDSYLDITLDIINGDFDIAVLPSNLARILNEKNGGDISILSTVTAGNMILCTKGVTVSSYADLAGKTIYTIDRDYGSDCLLRYLLSENGIDPDADVTIKYATDQNALDSLFETEEELIAVTSQPHQSAIITEAEISTVFELDDEFCKQADKGIECVNEVLVVNRNFAEANPEAVEYFIDDYEVSFEYATSYIAEASECAAGQGIISDPALYTFHAPHILSYCRGEEMKDIMSGYYRTICEYEGTSVPGEEFYYCD